jgi:hypothetical protein
MLDSAQSQLPDATLKAMQATIKSMRRTLWDRWLVGYSYLHRVRHLYLVLVVGFLLYWRTFWAPDLLFVIFLSVFILYGRGLEYARRFAPFVVLLVAYESLRGFAPMINRHIHYTFMPNFDRWLFGGHLPTVVLQQWWHPTAALHWYDFYFYFVYMVHFLAPFFLALLIWWRRPKGYWQYVLTLVGMSFAAFITYILYPAAPPWMASQLHIIPAITKLSTAIWWGWGLHNIPTVYDHLNPNAVAAVPSLHAAYPTLDFLFVNKLFGWKFALPFLIYPVSVWVGVVYMGEHYVVDVLLGILYAGVAFWLSQVIARRWAARRTGVVQEE